MNLGGIAWHRQCCKLGVTDDNGRHGKATDRQVQNDLALGRVEEALRETNC